MVQETKEAEIAKQKKIIEEEQEKSVKVIKAEAEAETLKKIAEGRKAAAKNDAEATIEKAKAESEAIQKKATAEAEGEKAKKEATVADQVKLLQEISKNQEYSKYLQAIKAIEMFGLAEQKKAEALQKADIKYLATGSENKYGGVLGRLSSDSSSPASRADAPYANSFSAFWRFPPCSASSGSPSSAIPPSGLTTTPQQAHWAN